MEDSNHCLNSHMYKCAADIFIDPSIGIYPTTRESDPADSNPALGNQTDRSD